MIEYPRLPQLPVIVIFVLLDSSAWTHIHVIPLTQAKLISKYRVAAFGIPGMHKVRASLLHR